jgi:hypothetical protein
MSWVLLILVYAGMLSPKEPMVLVQVPMQSKELCETEAKKIVQLTQNTIKEARWVCLKVNDK